MSPWQPFHLVPNGWPSCTTCTSTSSTRIPGFRLAAASVSHRGPPTSNGARTARDSWPLAKTRVSSSMPSVASRWEIRFHRVGTSPFGPTVMRWQPSKTAHWCCGTSTSRISKSLPVRRLGVTCRKRSGRTTCRTRVPTNACAPNGLDVGEDVPEHNPDTLHGARERVRQALAAGDVLMAYDAASSLAPREPSSLEARYLLALSLARSGSILRAAIDAEHVLVEMRARNVKDLRLLEDVQALSARLTKERALAASGDARARLAEQAAERYERSALELGGHYSYVNAATLWLLAGRHQRSTRMAKKAMRAVEETADLGPEAAYWRWASAAEASLLLGDVVSTRDSLTNATNVPGVGAALYAVT